MDGFMIQGGDPEGSGSGGADETVKGEFAANGVENPISHVKGVISMARAKDAQPIDDNGTIPAAQQPVIERIVISG